MAVAPSSEAEQRGVQTRHVEHQRVVVAHQKVEQGAELRGVDRPRRHTRRRAEQIEPGARADDQAAQKRFVQPVGVLERFGNREAGLDAEEHRGIAGGEVQIDQQRVVEDTRECGGQIDRDRRRADAAFGADHGVNAVLYRFRLMHDDPAERCLNGLTRQRLGNGLADARAHRSRASVPDRVRWQRWQRRVSETAA